jgi:hypothetical protein
MENDRKRLVWVVSLLGLPLLTIFAVEIFRASVASSPQRDVREVALLSGD